MTKNIKFVITRFVFSSSKCIKIRFRPGLRPRPSWGSLRCSPDPSVSWGGGMEGDTPSPFPPLLSPSVLRPPQYKILATPVPNIVWCVKFHPHLVDVYSLPITSRLSLDIGNTASESSWSLSVMTTDVNNL